MLPEADTAGPLPGPAVAAGLNLSR